MIRRCAGLSAAKRLRAVRLRRVRWAGSRRSGLRVVGTSSRSSISRGIGSTESMAVVRRTASCSTGLERQSDLRRSARHRLQRPLRPHLLSSAVRHRMARASPILTSKVIARPGRSAPRLPSLAGAPLLPGNGRGAKFGGVAIGAQRYRGQGALRCAGAHGPYSRRRAGRSVLSRPRRRAKRHHAQRLRAPYFRGATAGRRGDHARTACRRIRRVARACALNRSARLR